LSPEAKIAAFLLCKSKFTVRYLISTIVEDISPPVNAIMTFVEESLMAFKDFSTINKGFSTIVDKSFTFVEKHYL